MTTPPARATPPEPAATPRRQRRPSPRLALAALLLLASRMDPSAQPAVLGQATAFTTDEYFAPPDEQRVKMRLSGATADPLPGGALAITDLQILTFNLDGATNATVAAPECVYAPYDGLAHSAGPLRIETGGGKIVITGEGFLWQQHENTLIISNHVHTVLQMKAFQFKAP